MGCPFACVQRLPSLPSTYALVQRPSGRPQHFRPASQHTHTNNPTASSLGSPHLVSPNNPHLSAPAWLTSLGFHTSPLQDLQGVFSAREFVWWYNGHPHYASLPIDLARTRRVAICGLGNVAVDCARVLLQPPRPGLAATDIASHAVAALERSGVEEVHLIGRRGPAQVSMPAVNFCL